MSDSTACCVAWVCRRHDPERLIALSQPSERHHMDAIDVLRHLVATLAYRAAKAMRDVPAEFPHASVSPNTRRPILIVAHLADLMAWALPLADGRSEWSAGG